MASTAQEHDVANALKESIYRLIEDLPFDDLQAAERYISYLHHMARDPLLRSLIHAPIDDEPVTPEEEALIEEGLEDFRAGRVVSHEEAKQRLLGKS